MKEDTLVHPPPGAVGPGKAAGILRPKYLVERSPWMRLQEDGAGDESKETQELWEAQWQAFLKNLEPTEAGRGDAGASEVTPWEDARAFLASFEQVAKACRWPRGEWSSRLLPALSGEAEEAFRSLEAADQGDYGKVKAAILRGDALRLERQRQHFRHFSCQEVEDPRRIHRHLQELCHRWLRPERRSKEQIVELLVLEQFLASLPPDLQGWIRAGGPDSCSQAVALVEDLLSSKTRTETRKWPEPTMEEGPPQSETEEPVKVPEGKARGDLERNRQGNGIKCPSQTSLLLPLEVQIMDQARVKEEPMELSETSLSLQVVKRSPNQPGKETMLWTVLQDDGKNDDPLGGNQVQDNSPPGPTPPEEMPREATPIGPRTVTVKCEMEAESIILDEQWAIQWAGRGEGGRLTESQASLLSKYGQRGRYMSEPERAPGKEGLHAQPVTQEASRLTSHRGEPQSPSAGERGPASTKCGKGRPTRPLRGSQAQECWTNSQGSQQGLENPRGSSRSSPGAQQGPYPCAQCGKSYREERRLKRHEKLHAAEKPFVCSECPKGFIWKSDLLRHRKTHLRKRFQCSECGKFFPRKDTLTHHQKSHVGQSPSSRRRSSAKDERKRLQS